MAGRSDAFNQAAGTRVEGVSTTPSPASAPSRPPVSSDINAPRYGGTKSSGEIIEPGIKLKANEDLAKERHLQSHNEAMVKDRSTVSKGVQRTNVRNGVAESTPRQLKAKDLLAKGNEFTRQLTDHVTQVSAAFPNHEVISPITDHAKTSIINAMTSFHKAGSYDRATEGDKIDRSISEGYRHLSEANDMLNQRSMVMHSGVPISPVGTDSLEHHKALAQGYASDPSRHFKARGKAPKSMDIAGAKIPTRTPEGRAVIREIGKAAKAGLPGVDQQTAGAIVDSSKGTPRKRKADREALREAQIPVNAKTVKTDDSLHSMRNPSAKFEAYPHPNAPRPSSYGSVQKASVEGAIRHEAGSTSGKADKINARAAELRAQVGDRLPDIVPPKPEENAPAAKAEKTAKPEPSRGIFTGNVLPQQKVESGFTRRNAGGLRKQDFAGRPWTRVTEVTPEEKPQSSTMDEIQNVVKKINARKKGR